jgi:hypothetical protein
MKTQMGIVLLAVLSVAGSVTPLRSQETSFLARDSVQFRPLSNSSWQSRRFVAFERHSRRFGFAATVPSTQVTYDTSALWYVPASRRGSTLRTVAFGAVGLVAGGLAGGAIGYLVTNGGCRGCDDAGYGLVIGAPVGAGVGLLTGLALGIFTGR